MKKKLLLSILVAAALTSTENIFGQTGFPSTPTVWNIPNLDGYAERTNAWAGEHTLIDINGDNKLDLIDLEDDNNLGYTWLNGSQKYWKVYLGTGSSFSSSAANWNIPDLDGYAERVYAWAGEHALIDMNGDNKPDLVDLEDDNSLGYTWLNGSQKYWKVYLNTGTAFSSTASNWNIPNLDGYAERAYAWAGEHAIMDMNGDNKPDLVDLEDDNNLGYTWLNGSQKYWKVYISTGTAFATTAANWNIPNLDGYAERANAWAGEHTIMDMNGDNKPDLVDLEDDNNLGYTWLNGSQKYWKVYISTGTAFSSAAANWNIPNLDGYAERANAWAGEHVIMDMNGDNKPDLVDLEDDNNLGYTWLNGSQKYWKVFISTGTAFSASGNNWNIPNLDGYAQRANAWAGEHALLDFNGDNRPDLADLEDDNNLGYTWLSGSQKYWKVYLNSQVGFEDLENTINATIYPNPFSGNITIQLENFTGIGSVVIFNMLGENIFVKQITDQRTEIGFDNLERGIYFMKITTSEGSVTKKIIKE